MFTNIFAQLDIEEPSKNPLSRAPEPTAYYNPRSNNKVNLDLGNDENDVAFRLFCFLEDPGDV